MRKYQLNYFKLLTYNGILVRKNLEFNCNSLFYRLFDCIPLKQGLRLIFYYRFPGGEAGTDVYDRINDLLGSLHRDFQRENYPRNCILVTHSLAIRLFIMRWFHLTVEEFEQMLSPKNGQLVVLQLNEETDDYELLTPLERDEKAVLRSRPIRLPCT